MGDQSGKFYMGKIRETVIILILQTPLKEVIVFIIKVLYII